MLQPMPVNAIRGRMMLISVALFLMPCVHVIFTGVRVAIIQREN
jgi:hypothetical protein